MFRYGHHAHHPVISIIFLVLIAALVVLAILALVRWRRHPHAGMAASWVGGPRPPAGAPPWAGADSAINELRIRYARGDISSEEYWQRASVLGYAPSPPSPGSPPSAGTGPAGPPPPGPTPPPAP
ncbi:MAG TPA: SHOCT domain-containing protein [Acidimicrobiales bacterium]|jgi:uncharacterized membrane protein|nr:SHOCT domain-containing protein [Acidimicrobiales bacterium]